MSMPSLRSLLEAGAHFGHLKEHSHPASRRFVYTIKDGVLVINVEKTVEALAEAIEFMKKTLQAGGTILFVGTKPQAHEAVKKTALALNQPYVSVRWLGGTLTNFDTVKKSLFQLQELERKINDPIFETLRKRERQHIMEKHAKLTQIFEGILTLTKPPEAMFVVDANYEDIAVAEANRLGIPVVAVTDTNANPEKLTYVIPANDESKRAIGLIMDVIAAELSDVKGKLKEEKTPQPEVHPSPKSQPVQAKQAVKRVRKVKKSAKPVKSARPSGQGPGLARPGQPTGKSKK